MGSVNPVVVLIARVLRKKQPVEREMVGHEEYSSKEPPHLSNFGKVVKAAKKAAKDSKNHAKDVPLGEKGHAL